MALNLGHNLDDLAAAGAQVALQVVDHIGCFDKGDSDEVHTHLNGKVNVHPILQMSMPCVNQMGRKEEGKRQTMRQ